MTASIQNQPERYSGAGGLIVRDLTKAFAGRLVLRGVSFAVSPGASIGFLGANGAGKTTLFRILAGFEHSDSGSISLDGRQLRASSPSAICRLGMATTFQRPLQAPGFTVEEIMRLAQSLPNRPVPSRGHNDLLTKLVPRDIWSRSICSLDGAMLRRVDFARALATQPRIVLLDEVFASQDRSGTDQIVDSIAQARRLGVAFLVADHVPEVLTGICCELHVLDEGQLALSGSPAAVVEAAIARRFYFGSSTNLPAS